MKQSLLPEGAKETLKRFFERIASLVFFILAGICVATIYDYHPGDPSLNTATASSPKHILSYPGSYVADILFQMFGKLSYVIPLFFAGYALRLWTLSRISVVFRPILFLLGLTALAFSLSGIFNHATGSIGFLLYKLSYYKMADYPLIAMQVGAFSTAIPLILVGSHFSLSRQSFENTVSGLRSGWLHSLKAPLAILPFTKGSSKSDTPAHHDTHQEPMLHEDAFETEAPEQLNLFREPHAESHDDDYDDDGTSNNHAIADFKKWLDDKEKKKSNPKNPAKKKDTSNLFEAYAQEHLTGGEYVLPPIELLDQPKQRHRITHNQDDLEAYAHLLETVLGEFGVKGEIVNIRPGPVVTMYELMPAAGIKSSRVIGLADDIARSMSAMSARIAVIPGKNVLGIELPNKHRETVFLRELLQTEAYKKHAGHLGLILGKDIGGNPSIADLSKMPHLLVAGTTGSGKSVSVNTMILSLLFSHTPDECKFIMIDPKMLELSVYNDIPHLLTPVVTDPKKAVIALKWAVKEMESRYRAMSKVGVRNIDGYNTRLNEAKMNGEVLSRRVQTGFDTDSGKPIFETQPLDLTPLPYIVVVVDEMADLMLVAGKEIESAVQRLAQMARAAGIHLIMATQRPSVDVITGTIKANFPTRMSFQVTSKIDSRTILGEQGAEQLLGQGDMLFMAGGGRIHRVHGPFVKDEEVERVVAFLKTQGEPSYMEAVVADEDEGFDGDSSSEGNGKDDLYRQAVDLVLREGKASTSFVQRHLQIGYNRAARLIDQMEKEGVISPANHVGKREILDRQYA